MPNQRPEIRPERSVRYKGRVYKRGDEDALVEALGKADDAKAAAGVGPNKAGGKASSVKDSIQRLTDRGDIVGFGATPSDLKGSTSGTGTLGVKPGEKVPLAGARRQNNVAGQDTQRTENGGDGDPTGRTGGTRDLANRTSSDAVNAGTSGAETESSGGSKSSSGKGGRKRSSSGTGGRKRGK